jgi:hypothetical protein
MNNTNSVLSWFYIYKNEIDDPASEPKKTISGIIIIKKLTTSSNEDKVCFYTKTNIIKNPDSTEEYLNNDLINNFIKIDSDSIEEFKKNNINNCKIINYSELKGFLKDLIVNGFII